MDETFGQRLQERIRALGPLCVGIDPSASLLTSWNRPDTVEGLEFMSLAVLEASVGSAAAVKAQVAYFERFGSAGYRVLERLIADAHDAGILVIADAKRGDIGATNAAYASAWLDESSTLCCDAMTVSPFTGVGALAPFFARAVKGRGVFVLAATSNDEGRSLQRARTEGDEAVEDLILRSIAELNRRDEGVGSLGVVLGATRDRPRFDLAALQGPYLVPGVGAQGATPEQVGRLFERCPDGTVLVNVARSILETGPERSALRDSVRRWRDNLTTFL
ncbi:MAG: orotidine-5'-phosphate decarboxylase [Actinomycetota bacterium]|jgi:orotidine-5'-phosphate decarboxylase|nr:orotidine-5'-phosphate decarboxylase [Actinomycetota bacterium]